MVPGKILVPLRVNVLNGADIVTESVSVKVEVELPATTPETAMLWVFKSIVPLDIKTIAGANEGKAAPH